MTRAGAILLLLATMSSPGLRAQVPSSPRTFLLFVDDLHLEFQSTPRVRQVALRVVADLTRPGDRWAIVTTGRSSVSVAPTLDRTVIDAAIRRITGGGLTTRAFLDLRERPDGLGELRRLASIAIATAADAIKAVSAGQEQRPVTVVYVSNGYDASAIAEPTAVITAAVNARARVYTIDARGWSNADSRPGISPAEWDAYLDATRGVLRTLASRTEGLAVFADGDLDRALSRVASGDR